MAKTAAERKREQRERDKKNADLLNDNGLERMTRLPQ